MHASARIGISVSVLLGLAAPLHAEQTGQAQSYYYPQAPFFAPFAPFGYQAPARPAPPQPVVSPAQPAQASARVKPEAPVAEVPSGDATVTGAPAASEGASEQVIEGHFRLEQARLGAVLADLDGRTLYSSSADAGDGSVCEAGCEGLWSPVLIDGKLVPAPPFGALQRKDGSLQWTYDGHALYRWTGDQQAGDVTGDGVDGTWRAVRIRQG